MYRQGDVLIVPVEVTPEGVELSPDEDGNHVVAEGEMTGHAHRIRAGDAELVEVGGTLFLKVARETPLVHEEHRPLTIPEGGYRVVLQREFEGGMRAACE